jgi:hypothetical protein
MALATPVLRISTVVPVHAEQHSIALYVATLPASPVIWIVRMGAVAELA